MSLVLVLVLVPPPLPHPAYKSQVASTGVLECLVFPLFFSFLFFYFVLVSALLRFILYVSSFSLLVVPIFMVPIVFVLVLLFSLFFVLVLVLYVSCSCQASLFSPLLFLGLGWVWREKLRKRPASVVKSTATHERHNTNSCRVTVCTCRDRRGGRGGRKRENTQAEIRLLFADWVVCGSQSIFCLTGWTGQTGGVWYPPFCHVGFVACVLLCIYTVIAYCDSWERRQTHE